jgi:putative Mg2+ transporter-C (MgtC) family protein
MGLFACNLWAGPEANLACGDGGNNSVVQQKQTEATADMPENSSSGGDMMADTEMLIRLVTAAALGSLIGFERERLLWAAGIRTHMLVCVGSCLIMIVSQYGFANVLTQQNVVLDPSRIAAQVVSGIGFLGAGAILARGEIVKGLTTAASIWTVAAVGLAVGGGLYLAASASTVIILIILAGIKPLEEAYRSRNQSCQLKIEVDNGGLTPELLRSTLDLRAGQVKRFLVESRNQDGTDELVILLSKVSSQDIATYPEKLKELDGVRQVTILKRAKDQGANPT